MPAARPAAPGIPVFVPLGDDGKRIRAGKNVVKIMAVRDTITKYLGSFFFV